MNNLKRVLSLALASVMLIGMMVVGASAADFSDAEDIQHKEAVDVLVALDVINGKEDGTYFAPGDNVTRGEMAKMIAVAMKGGNDVNTGTKGVPSFTDISGHWAESYIEYCFDLGIISGRGDGTFDPNANVTGTEVTKMVLSALGYDADAYKLKGASWAVRTDELARKADPQLYEGLSGVVLNVPASRDTAAQLIWNGLQNGTMEYTPETNKSSGEITWGYGSSGRTMLKERYNGDIWYGWYYGNDKTDTSLNDGEIIVKGSKNDDYTGKGTAADPVYTYAHVPSDMDISNIGEKVKVIWKDVSGGTPNQPDNKDVIYGVFNTGATQVIRTTVSEVGKDGTSTTKMKIDGTSYTISDDGKVEGAYVVTKKMTKITATTSSKVTLQGVGTIDIADNDIYDGAKQDDVVVYSKLYDADKDDAYFIVTKAETRDGTLTGYKNNSSDSATTKVTVSGTTYDVHNEALVEATDDAIDVVEETDINSAVTLYMVGKMVGALEVTDETTSSYALVTASNGGKVDTTYDGLSVKVLTSDGTEAKYEVHKDSTLDDDPDHQVKIKGSAGEDTLFGYDGGTVDNTLIKYTLSGGKIKIKDIVTDTNTVGDVVTVNDGKKVWNKDTKSVAMNAAATQTAVAASDAVAFVHVFNVDENGVVETDKYYAYNLRDLSTITASGTTPVQVYTNKDGLVAAIYVEQASRVSASGANTYHGMVSNADGVVKVGSNNDTYYKYRVIVDNSGDKLTVYSTDTFVVGDIVTFNEAADQIYESNDITLVSHYDSGSYTFRDVAKTGAVAVDSYSSAKGILSYYGGTVLQSDDPVVYMGADTKLTYTVEKDVDIVCVKADPDNRGFGSENGVAKFSEETGYANAILFMNSDGNVEAIVVETSDKISLAAENFPGEVEIDAPTVTLGEEPLSADEATDVAVDSGTAELVVTPAAGTTLKSVKVDGASKTIAENAVSANITVEDEGPYTIVVKVEAGGLTRTFTYVANVTVSI